MKVQDANAAGLERAELAVIGACLIESAAIAAARQFTAPEHFQSGALGAVFEAILGMADVGRQVDVVTLAGELGRAGKLGEIGGTQALTKAIDTAQHAAHAASYAKIVARAFYEREIAREARLLADDSDQKHVETIAALCLARGHLDSPSTFDYATGLHDFLDDLADPKQDQVFRFQLGALDQITDGLKKGEVNTFGAATNMGKSLLLLNLMDRQAQAGARCLFVGSEMTAKETCARHLSIRSGLEAWKIRLRKLSSSELGTAQEAIAGQLSTLPIQILDDPEPTVEAIEAAVARAKPDAVFVDYLERMSLPPAENLRLSVKEFMRKLKSLARKRGVIVFLASQLSRKTYASAEDTPPTLADLSESSAIEKESDRVFLIHRPRMLQPEPIPGVADYRSVLEIIKAKDRHGPNRLKAHLELDGRTLRLKEAGRLESTEA